MNDLRKAAEMAFTELCNQRDAHYTKDIPTELTQAIQALRQALAQPEQEQYVTKVVAMHEDGTYTTERIPLPKREWVGLTDDEAWECWNWEDFNETWKKMEAKLKDKNT